MVQLNDTSAWSASVNSQVSVVLQRTMGNSDWRLDDLCGSHLRSQSEFYVSGDWPDWLNKQLCDRLWRLSDTVTISSFQTVLTRTITLYKLQYSWGRKTIYFVWYSQPTIYVTCYYYFFLEISRLTKFKLSTMIPWKELQSMEWCERF